MPRSLIQRRCGRRRGRSCILPALAKKVRTAPAPAVTNPFLFITTSCRLLWPPLPESHIDYLNNKRAQNSRNRLRLRIVTEFSPGASPV